MAHNPIPMPADTTAPSAPGTITAYSRFKAVHLEWERPTPKDFSHVELWRSANPAGPGTRLAKVDSDSYTDEIGLWDATFYYNLKAVDRAGNVSGLGNWTVGSTDINAPAPPTNLSVSTGAIIDADGHVIPYLDATWTPSPTEDVQAHELEQQYNIGAAWQNPSTQRTSGSAAARLSPVPGDVSYRVRVRALDDAQNPSPWTGYETGTTPKDNVAPGTASALSGQGLFKAIKLTWDNPDDYDFLHTEVHRHTANNTAAATLLARTDSEQFVDEDLAITDSYYYWLKTVDTSRNKSAFAAFGQVSTDDDPPPVPTGLSVTPGTDLDEDGHQYSHLKCSWDNNAGTAADFGRHELAWTIGTADVTEHATTQGTVHTIFPVQANKSYSVQVRSLDRFGNASDYSSAETGTTAKDSQAPSNPTSVSTASLFKSILIEWDNPSDSDLAYVEVYRASDGAGTGSTKIAEVRGTSYTDELNTWDATFYYRLKAVDNSGNASSGTAWTEGNTDTTPPSAPSSLSVSSGTIEDADGKIIIYLDASWTDSSDDDVKDHEVEVWFDLDDDASYADEDPETHRVQASPLRIMGVPGNVDYRVRVRAVDDANLKSAWTGYETGTTTKDNSAPSTPSGLAVTAALKAIRIEIDKPNENDWVGTEFHVSDSNGFTPEPGTLVHVGRTTSHLHKTDDYATKYVKVRVYDSSGNYSDYTAQGSATPSKTGNDDVDDGGLNAAKILISGAVNLDDWRHGSDLTAIDGGDIYANSITLSQIDGSSLDGRAVIRSDTEPTERESGDSLQAGDIWIETDEGNRAHTWDGAAWEDAVVQHTVMDGGYIAVLRQAGDANEKVEITASGVELHQGGNKLAELASDALKIYNSSGTQIAEYGGTLWVGASSTTERLQYDSTNGLRLFNHAGDVVIEFPTSGGANISGTVAITGTVTAGDGNVSLDTDGLHIPCSGAGGFAQDHSYAIMDGANVAGALYGIATTGVHTIYVESHAYGSEFSNLHLVSDAQTTGQSATIEMSALDDTDTTYFYIYSPEVTGGARIQTNEDLRVGKGLYVGATDTDPDSDWIYADGGLYVGDTANANQGIGITLNQGANDNEILALKSSDIAHGITSVTETDTYAFMKKHAANYGALRLVSLCEQAYAMVMRGIGTGENTTKSAAGYGTIILEAKKKSGTGTTGLTTTAGGGAGNVVSISNNGSTVAIFAGDGDLYLDTSINEGEWDEYDDISLIETVRAASLPAGHALRDRIGEMFDRNQQILRDTGVMSEGGFLAIRQWTYLLADALRQTNARMDSYEQEIIRLGGDPKRLALPA